MPAPEDHRALAHRPGCQLPDANHRGSCCTDAPDADLIHGPECPARPDQVITADRLHLAVRYATLGGGFTDATIEYPRLRADQARSDIRWGEFQAAVLEAAEARLDAMVNDPALADFITVVPSDDDAPPDDGGGVPTAKVRRYQDLRRQQSAAEAEAKAIKEEANLLEAELVDAFGEAGMQSVNIDGQTVYLHRSTFASWVDVAPEDRQQALTDAGAEDLITTTVNANTINAWVRELIGDEDNPGPGLPEGLVDKLELGEKFAVRIKTSTSRAKPKSRR